MFAICVASPESTSNGVWSVFCTLNLLIPPITNFRLCLAHLEKDSPDHDYTLLSPTTLAHMSYPSLPCMGMVVNAVIVAAREGLIHLVPSLALRHGLHEARCEW